MPNALLEAMAAGLPVVTTRAGGCGEIVENDVSGLLVDTHNAEAIAAALERVLTEPGVAEALALEGRERVRKTYSLAAMIGSMENAYRAALQDAGFKIPAKLAENKGDSRKSENSLLPNASGGNI